MSSVVISGNTSGSVSLVAPDVAGSSVQTLASVSGTLAPLVSGTVVTASGTSVDFTGIPSWAKRITVMFIGLSTNGTSAPMIQLGDAGGIEVTGYLGGTTGGNTTQGSLAHSTGILIHYTTFSAAFIISGSVTINLFDSASNLWVYEGGLARIDAAAAGSIAGSKSLSDVLTQLRITTVNGTDVYDAGTINIMYE